MRHYLIPLGIFIIVMTAGACGTGDPGVSEQREEMAALEATNAGLLEGIDLMAESSLRKPELPERQSLTRDAIPQFTEVPEHFEQLMPITATIVGRIRDQDGTTDSTRTFIRTSDRVYVNYENQGQEWLFIRNSLDGRRATGQLTDHREGAVLKFYETDLANAAIVRGWVDVVTMGVSVEQMSATGEIQEKHGMAFERYAGQHPGGQGAPQFEVWWSAEHALPWKIQLTTDEGGWVQEIVQLHTDMDQELLQDPIKRYPQYELMDLVDWREERHGH